MMDNRNLLDTIKSYGEAMYEAGVHEKEEDHVALMGLAEGFFSLIELALAPPEGLTPTALSELSDKFKEGGYDGTRIGSDHRDK